jgi:hypothetical protein
LGTVRSSVDVLPFLYSIALGNESWRCNADDVIGYLSGRESIMDAIFSEAGQVQQRRLSNIPLANPYGGECWQMYQPYIIHTTDELWNQTGSQPHAVAFRTVDNTVTGGFSNSPPFGGGKLGIYSFWYGCDPPEGLQPTYANDAANQQQFEYYNYSADSPGGDSLASNLGETGNQYFNPHPTPSASATLYVANFGTAASTPGNELTEIPTALGTTYSTALALWVAFSLGYQCTGGCAGD